MGISGQLAITKECFAALSLMGRQTSNSLLMALSKHLHSLQQ
jgi:hypothetical protein